MKEKQSFVHGLLAKAGISINDNLPGSIHIKDKRFYDMVLRDDSLGLGESYMKGYWECAELNVFIGKVLSANLESHIKSNLKLAWQAARFKAFNLQLPSQAEKSIHHHYDIGNELYTRMLDKRMTYTCARWKKGLTTLDEAQECKFELICRKLKLKKGDHILDIGCGWGSFAKYTAQHHGVRVTGITISKEQIVLARELCQGLPIEIRYMDYRDPLLRQEKFDHIISIGMFEHVGPKNYAQYMGIAYQCLKPGGLFLLHTIVGNKTSRSNDPWINKYIFPDSMLPSMKQIASAVEDTGFVTEDVENFGPDYAKTLGAWYDNFVASWSELVAIDPGKYTEEFFRMWTYYLLACKGLFESRSAQLHQYVLSKEVPHYDSVR